MKAGFSLCVTLAVILGVSWTPARADLYDFTIHGTYDETLTSPDGSVTLFSAGDPFTVQGTYDTGAQPVVEEYGLGDVTLPDASFLWTYDFSAITALTLTGIDLDLINQYYPSDPDVMNTGEEMNGAYTHHDHLVWQVYYANLFGVEVLDDFTRLHLQEGIANINSYPDLEYSTDAYIQYYYHMQQFTGYSRVVNGTVELTIDSVDVTEHVVPLPGSVVLLMPAMGTVFGLRRKLRKA